VNNRAIGYSQAMKRILLTGMSGVGKSSVIDELAARGYKAIDTDYGFCETGSDGDQLWLEDRLEGLLTTEDSDMLILAGCVTNQGKFDVIVERLRSRSNNPYGKHPEELALILEQLAEIEPLLRRGADHEIVTTLPLPDVVDAVLRIAQTVA